MIRIQQLKLKVDHNDQMLEDAIRAALQLPVGRDFSFEIVKKSIDARKKPQLFYVYTVDISMSGEAKLVKKLHQPNILLTQKSRYHFPSPGDIPLPSRPVIVGAGPAGLFCAYELALHGYRPIILERGKKVDERAADVRHFWESGVLDPSSNVQFGEGGAGTFSDGKLNTLIKDPANRGRQVLEIFCKCGAPSEILYEQKPHIGTDLLTIVIQNLREEILRLGGKFYFETCLVNLIVEQNQLRGIVVKNAKGRQQMDTGLLVLAPGHSARDTFEMLQRHDILMEPKAFAVGFRVEHPQTMINESQYGSSPLTELLPAAPYKVTANFPGGRSVYSFCMCPGGYVVNASSEQGLLAVNGMSNYRRDSANANSAIIISVSPADFPGDDALSGVRFQRQLERKAYLLCNGKIPQQLYADFQARRISDGYGAYDSCVKGAASFGPLHTLLTEEMNQSLMAGMEQFGRRIRGFDRADAILSGIESRTSSPLRILRNEQLQSSIAGLYPCGEGAGYAGGITSAAMDGIRIAETIAGTYHP